MMNRVHKVGVLCGVVLAAALWLAGCESSPSTDGVGTYFDDTPVVIELGEASGEVLLRVSPRSVTLASSGAIVVLTVEGGRSPYAWSVSDASRGKIIEKGAVSAVYQRFYSGDNVVICTDSRGRTGFASITQPVIEQGETGNAVIMRLSPRSATLENDGGIVVINVEGGRPPYSWSVSDVSRGNIIEVGSVSAGYQRSDSGDNVVICTDSRGQIGFATIDQP